MQAVAGVPERHVAGAPHAEPGPSGCGTRLRPRPAQLRASAESFVCAVFYARTMDPMVLRALSAFERNVSMYVQRPDRVRELQAGMTSAQSEALMAALVDCYPLAVLHQGLDRQKSGDAPLDIAAHILRSASPLSPPLVLETPALRLG